MGNRQGLVRIAALTGYQRVADRLGLNTKLLLRAAGVTPALLADPEQFVPAPPLVDMLDESARQAGCATFGLRMAMERTLSDMGLVSVLLALQPNFGALLETVARYRNSIVPIVGLRAERHGEIAVVHLDLNLPTEKPRWQVDDLLVGAFVGMGRALLGQDWHPECTFFCHAEPAPADRPLYATLFGSDLQFNADFNGFTLKLSDLQRSRESADPGLAVHATTLIDHVIRPSEQTLAQRVEEAISFLLGSSRATVEDAAHVLGLHPRTLQRRLEKEGVTFRHLVHDTRLRLASRFLANPGLSIAQVSDALGYSSSGAFSRWYRHEFGRSPKQGRALLAEA